VALRCVSPWETWPGEFPGWRAKRSHAACISVGRPLICLTLPNIIFQSTRVSSGFGKQLEIVAGFLSCMKTWCHSSTERGTKIAVHKISPTSLSHAWEAGMCCSVMDCVKRGGKPGQQRSDKDLNSKSCSEIFIWLGIVSQYLGMECCLVLVCRAGLPALQPLQLTAACD